MLQAVPERDSVVVPVRLRREIPSKEIMQRALTQTGFVVPALACNAHQNRETKLAHDSAPDGHCEKKVSF